MSEASGDESGGGGSQSPRKRLSKSGRAKRRNSGLGPADRASLSRSLSVDNTALAGETNSGRLRASSFDIERGFGSEAEREAVLAALARELQAAIAAEEFEACVTLKQTMAKARQAPLVQRTPREHAGSSPMRRRVAEQRLASADAKDDKDKAKEPAKGEADDAPSPKASPGASPRASPRAARALCEQCGKHRAAARVSVSGDGGGGGGGGSDGNDGCGGESDTLLLCKACVEARAASTRALVVDSTWVYEQRDDGKTVVHAASLDKLVEQLAVADAMPDWDFIEDFLITYRYFTTPSDLLKRLEQRYAYEVSDSLADAEREAALKWKGPVQMRVINILKKWIEQHYYDFTPPQHSSVLKELLAFVEGTIRANNERWAKSVLDEEATQRRLWHKIAGATADDDGALLAQDAPLEQYAYAMKQPETQLVSEQRSKGLRKYDMAFDGAAAVAWLCENVQGFITPEQAVDIGQRMVQATPKLVLPLAGDKEFVNDANALYQFAPLPNDPLTLVYPKPLWAPGDIKRLPAVTELPPEEVARQLTLLASRIYLRITTKELKSQAWAKDDAKQQAPNLTALIGHFNRTSYFVASSIVMQHELQQRIKTLKRFIRLAEAFLELRNYDGVFAVYLGLNIAAVSRLKKTWAALPDKYDDSWARISAFCSHAHNHRVYRTTLRTAQPPTLPYMAIYTADLTHIEDGNDDKTDRGLINFEKMRMIGAVWRDIARFQSVRHAYCFQPLDALQRWFTDAPLLTDDELYKASLAAEPRGASAPSSPKLSERPRSNSFSKMFGSLRRSNSTTISSSPLAKK